MTSSCSTATAKTAVFSACLFLVACAEAKINGQKSDNSGSNSPGSGGTGGSAIITLPDAGVAPNPTPIPLAGDAGGACTVLSVTIRDFSVNDPSKSFDNADSNVVVDDRGLVAKQLGLDKKPVWAKTGPTATVPGGKEAFDQWYRDVKGVNFTFRDFGITLAPTGTGTYAFDSTEFFPLDNLPSDNQGWGMEGKWHNFVFTTEIHTQFTYQKGQKFTFRGDDDVFVYVNGSLAIDLGGIHMPQEGIIDLDSLGLSENEVYPLDVFQAERYGVGSNFRIETSIECFVNIPIL
jgi:fibro-slime domain-containing protein